MTLLPGLAVKFGSVLVEMGQSAAEFVSEIKGNNNLPAADPCSLGVPTARGSTSNSGTGSNSSLNNSSASCASGSVGANTTC